MARLVYEVQGGAALAGAVGGAGNALAGVARGAPVVLPGAVRVRVFERGLAVPFPGDEHRPWLPAVLGVDDAIPLADAGDGPARPEGKAGLRREGLEDGAPERGVVTGELPRLDSRGDHGLDGGHEPVQAEGGERGVPVDAGHLRVPAEEVPGALDEEGAEEGDEDDQHLDEGEAVLGAAGRRREGGGGPGAPREGEARPGAADGGVGDSGAAGGGGRRGVRPRSPPKPRAGGGCPSATAHRARLVLRTVRGAQLAR